MQQDVTLEDGTKARLPVNGYKSPRLLALSDRLIKPPDQQRPLPEGIGDFYGQYRLPDEPIEGPGSPRKKVSDSEFEITLAHELVHIALPDSIQGSFPLPGPAPTLYGRYNKTEQIAELGAAEYKGGDAALAVPHDQREVIDNMWQAQVVGSAEDDLYRRPIGPRFVVGKELDITEPLPLRTKIPNKPLKVEVDYRLDPAA
jgi:hypothetical protein